MAKVSININGRKYALGCEDGEEERLMRLGQKLDDRVNNMADQFGQIGDLRLMVMAGITMLDELDDMNKSVDSEVDKRVVDLRKESALAAKAATRSETKATDSLLSAAERIESLARRLSGEPE